MGSCAALCHATVTFSRSPSVRSSEQSHNIISDSNHSNLTTMIMENTTTTTMNSHTISGRRVSFGNVEIIELPYTLGDNPSVSGGVPIAASWLAQKRTSFKVEFFEGYRPKRRSKQELHLTRAARKKLMLQSGYSPLEIVMATREATRIRKQRLETFTDLRLKLQASMIAKERVVSSPAGYRSSPVVVQPIGGFGARRQLPPSPIVPKRSPAAKQTPQQKIPHLQFPNMAGGVLSPRLLPPQPPQRGRGRVQQQRRKRAAPTSFKERCSKFEDPPAHTPKRRKSPRQDLENEDPVGMPPVTNLYPKVRALVRRRPRSPIPDCRPLVLPKRFASPPPAPPASHVILY